MHASETLPKFIKCKSDDLTATKKFEHLPKNIFQTWESSQVSPKMYHAVQSWLVLNPDWNYYFYSKDERREFIVDNFDQEILDAYDALIPGAYKADLWRYCVLYINGGVYADIKISLCDSLNRLLNADTQFASVNERQGAHHLKGAVWNTFIAAMPKHPFLKKAIDMIVENVKTVDYGKNALFPTGPFLLGSAINSQLGRKNHAAFKSGEQEIGEYPFTLWFTPKNVKGKYSLANKYVYNNKKMQRVCFLPNYYGYREEKNYCSEKLNHSYDYAYCWRNYKIYNKELNENKLLYPTLKQIKIAYQSSEYSKARGMIKNTFIKYSQFHWKLIRYFVQYESINLVNRSGYIVSKILTLPFKCKNVS